MVWITADEENLLQRVKSTTAVWQNNFLGTISYFVTEN